MPMIAEEYHADWNRKEHPQEAELWYSDIPLIVHDVPVGRLRITGASKPGSVCGWMGDLIVGLKPFETQLLEMLSEHIGEHIKSANEDTVEITRDEVAMVDVTSTEIAASHSGTGRHNSEEESNRYLGVGSE